MVCSKAEIHSVILQHLQERLEQGKKDFQLAKESRDSDTKSSAGDKFETGREMMQREMDKISASLDMQKSQLAQMQRIDLQENPKQVGIGSFIETDAENYYLSVGLGKLTYSDTPFYAISADSPMGELLMGKQKGDTIELRGRIITLKSIR
jgi:transcription elongation GreA/GreB family factor